jgi:hypothetical protein
VIRVWLVHGSIGGGVEFVHKLDDHFVLMHICTFVKLEQMWASIILGNKKLLALVEPNFFVPRR